MSKYKYFGVFRNKFLRVINKIAEKNNGEILGVLYNNNKTSVCIRDNDYNNVYDYWVIIIEELSDCYMITLEEHLKEDDGKPFSLGIRKWHANRGEVTTLAKEVAKQIWRDGIES